MSDGQVTDPVHPIASHELAARRKQAAPGIHDAFQASSRQAFASVIASDALGEGDGAH